MTQSDTPEAVIAEAEIFANSLETSGWIVLPCQDCQRYGIFGVDHIHGMIRRLLTLEHDRSNLVEHLRTERDALERKIEGIEAGNELLAQHYQEEINALKAERDALQAELMANKGHPELVQRVCETAANNLHRAEQAEAERDALQQEVERLRRKVNE